MRDSKRDTDIKNRLLDSVWEGKGGMIWQNNNETCILAYVKQMTSPSSIFSQGTQIPQVMRLGQEKKKETEILNNVIILLKESESRSVDPTL